MPGTRPVALTPHRQRVLEILSEGPIEDPDGRAVALLQPLTGHHTTNALSGVLEAMERQGLIRRHVAGRRTYRIELASDDASAEPRETPSTIERLPDPAPEAPPPPDGVDYDLLAGVLLKKALMATQAQENSADVQQLRRALLSAETKASASEEKVKELRDEVAELKAAVKTLEHNNKVLTGQMDKVRKAPGTPVKDLISAKELRELDALMKALPSARG